ncbi:MAG: hypothetical protein HPY57_15290 [Ignavibacteria bacterium]|nr:hypothetical protein [Ignavibacteria bacterium]
MKARKNIKKIITLNNYIKANRHGEWLAHNENERGFISKHKIHHSKKSYTRKLKHKLRYENYTT